MEISKLGGIEQNHGCVDYLRDALPSLHPNVLQAQTQNQMESVMPDTPPDLKSQPIIKKNRRSCIQVYCPGTSFERGQTFDDTFPSPILRKHEMLMYC